MKARIGGAFHPEKAASKVEQQKPLTVDELKTFS